MTGHFIDGARVTDTVRTTPVFNPSTGAVHGAVAHADQTTVDKTLTAAERAWPAWRSTPPAKRAHILFRYKSLLEQHAGDICRLIGEEHGKIEHDARGELQRGIENVEYACAAPELLKGEHNRNAGPAIDSWSEFQPLGTVVGITPFNFPAMVPLWMFPLAIACGNSFVLKPSERTPSAAVLIAELLHKAGLPDGVMNVINGGKETVNLLLRDPRVKAVSFVGSTAVAQSIYTTATTQGKRCQALGGAKNHAIIMPDADLDWVVNQLLGAAFGSSGERCMALSVAVAVGDDTARALVSKLKDAMAGLKVGAWCNSENDFGPLITAAHRARVCALIDSAEQDGAKIVVDGRRPKVDGFEQGFYVGATLIDRVTPAMQSYREEIFGPVLQVMQAASLDRAIAQINAHEYGNGGCIFTRDGATARYFTDNITVGMVGVNVPLPVPVACQSFGGWKGSLFGDLHAYGPDAVRFYTKRKTITQRWPTPDRQDTVSFSFPS